MQKDTLSHNQLERLKFIDFYLYFTAQIRRNNLIDKFGVSEAAATRDLSLYKELAPKNIIYDMNYKAYRISEHYKRVFLQDLQEKDLLLELVHGFGAGNISSEFKSLIPCELPTRLYTPQIDIFAAVSRALANKKPMKISYFSQSSGSTEREIAPFSFAGNGLRWHVRAFDRRKDEFRDFVINRITAPEVLYDGKIEEHEREDKDVCWSTFVNLEIIPHPKLKHTKHIEIEYQMKNSASIHNVRASMAAYFLRLWNVDCSGNSKDNPNEHQLYLKNLCEVEKLADLKIAPGYISS